MEIRLYLIEKRGPEPAHLENLLGERVNHLLRERCVVLEKLVKLRRILRQRATTDHSALSTCLLLHHKYTPLISHLETDRSYLKQGETGSQTDETRRPCRMHVQHLSSKLNSRFPTRNIGSGQVFLQQGKNSDRSSQKK